MKKATNSYVLQNNLGTIFINVIKFAPPLSFMKLFFEKVFQFAKLKKNNEVTNKLSYIKRHEQQIMKEKKPHGQTTMLNMNQTSSISTKEINEQIDNVVPQVRKMFRQDKHSVLVFFKFKNGKEQSISFKNINTLKQQINLSVAITYAIRHNSQVEYIITSYMDLNLDLQNQEEKYYINHNNKLSNTRIPFTLNRFGLDKENLSSDVKFDFNKPFESIIQKVNVIKQLENKLRFFNSDESEEGVFKYGSKILAPDICHETTLSFISTIKKMTGV